MPNKPKGSNGSLAADEKADPHRLFNQAQLARLLHVRPATIKEIRVAGAPFFKGLVAQIQTAKRVYPGRQSVIVWSSPRLGRHAGAGPPLSVRSPQNPRGRQIKTLVRASWCVRLSCFSLKRAEMAAGAERYWKIFPPSPATNDFAISPDPR